MLVKTGTMNYIEAHLQPGEKVEYRAHIHPFILAQPLVILLVGLIYYRTSTGVNQFLGVCLSLVGTVSLMQRVLIMWGSVFVVTNLRLLFKTGIISRKARDIVLMKVEGMFIAQSVFGRFLGYGSLIVTTGGATSTYTYVARPMRFKREINSRIEKYCRAFNNQEYGE